MSKPKIDKYGTKKWYNSKGQLHRENGPAIEYAGGAKVWFKNGKKHRLNGPAVEFTYKYSYWYIQGRHYTKEQYQKEVEKYISKKKLFILRLKYE